MHRQGGLGHGHRGCRGHAGAAAHRHQQQQGLLEGRQPQLHPAQQGVVAGESGEQQPCRRWRHRQVVETAELQHQGGVAGHASGHVQCHYRVDGHAGGFGGCITTDQALGRAAVLLQPQCLAGPLEAVGLAQRLNRQQQGAFVLQLPAELLLQILHLRRRDRAAHQPIGLDLGAAGRCRCRGDR